MKQIVVIFLLLACVPSACFAKGKNLGNNNRSASGTYTLFSRDSLAGAILTLNRDGTFTYQIGTDISTYHSDGKWYQKKDTLILNSSVQHDNIPIEVKEERVDSLGRRIYFPVINNQDHDAMIATISFNGDTSIQCDPLLQTDCNVNVGRLKTLRVQIGDFAFSKWYRLKKLKSNRIIITVPMHDVLDRYIFLHNELLILKNNEISPIVGSEIEGIEPREYQKGIRVVLKKKS